MQFGPNEALSVRVCEMIHTVCELPEPANHTQAFAQAKLMEDWEVELRGLLRQIGVPITDYTFIDWASVTEFGHIQIQWTDVPFSTEHDNEWHFADIKTADGSITLHD